MNPRSLFRRSEPLAALTAAAVLLSLSVVPLSAKQTGLDEPDFAAIDRFVESERQAMRVPGVAIGVVRGDRVVHLAAFGQADPTGWPVTPQTHAHRVDHQVVHGDGGHAARGVGQG